LKVSVTKPRHSPNIHFYTTESTKQTQLLALLKV
jgi:hypothetical protein